MSIVYPIEQITETEKKIIVRELHFKKCAPKPKHGLKKKDHARLRSQEKEIIAYRIDDDNISVFLPFYFAKNVLRKETPPRERFQHDFGFNFCGSLRDSQKEVQKEAISSLNDTGGVLLALHVGFGKSILATSIACRIRLRTLIIVHRTILRQQWETSIRQFCEPSRGEKLSASLVEQQPSFVIANAINVPKMERAELLSFGTVIVDECHLISAEQFSKSLQHVCPRYIMGLSATPYRGDGMDKIMDLYIHPKRIVRHLRIPHTVYEVRTSLVPESRVTKNGQLDWGHILKCQAEDTGRNRLIADIVCHPGLSGRRILILCKRRDHGQQLCDIISERNVRVARLMHTDQDFDREARVLVGTTSKIGVGFSFDVLDTLVLACDVQDYYIQYLGRIMRRPDVVPVVFDIVDKHPVLVNHYRTRKNVYKEIGGQVIKLKDSVFKDLVPL